MGYYVLFSVGYACLVELDVFGFILKVAETCLYMS